MMMLVLLQQMELCSKNKERMESQFRTQFGDNAALNPAPEFGSLLAPKQQVGASQH